MTELVCNFAIVRFLPYRETGEFVNVGVVVHAPETGFFGHRIRTDKRNARVHRFFPEIERGLYGAATASLDAELTRRTGDFAFAVLAGGDAVGRGMTLFRDLLKRRESLLHFAEPGMRLGRPTDVLTAIYEYYVERHFARRPAYQEELMRERLAGWLSDWGLQQRYATKARVGDDKFHFTLPFVHTLDGGPVAPAAIKPLDLDRPEPTDIFDHGGYWALRFRRLRDRGQLPGRMIVPVHLPVGQYRPIADAVVSELVESGATVTAIDDQEQIHALAAV
jgi:hypothetical protein